MATPATALIGMVPESVPPPGLVPMATAMLAAEEVTGLPRASCTVTCTAGAMKAPAMVVGGCAVNTSFAAAPAEMLKAALDAPVSPPADAVRV